MLREKLRRAVPIDWQILLTQYKDLKFIDAEPPLPYTLFVLWDLMFSKRASGHLLQLGEVSLDVEIGELTREVQDFFGFRSDGPHAIEVPRVSWIRKALDALVTFEMATKVSDGNYRVRYKRYRIQDKDTMLFFGKRAFKHRERLQLQESKKPLLEMIAAADASPESGSVDMKPARAD